MTKAANRNRVLAVYPTYRGFGFAILEGPTTLMDWGVRSVRSTSIEKEIGILSKITDLIRHYRPRSLILEKPAWKGSRRCGRIRLLLASIQNHATWEGVKARGVSPEKLEKVFLTFGAVTKHQIARAVAQQLPELAIYLPRQRKAWMSEDYRMAIFDAAALALTYFFYSRPMRDGRS
jgi:hypothetical protein